jgi:hypothetical protein
MKAQAEQVRMRHVEKCGYPPTGNKNTLNCQVLMAEESRCSSYCNTPPVTLLIAIKVNMQDKK